MKLLKFLLSSMISGKPLKSTMETSVFDATVPTVDMAMIVQANTEVPSEVRPDNDNSSMLPNPEMTSVQPRKASGVTTTKPPITNTDWVLWIGLTEVPSEVHPCYVNGYEEQSEEPSV